MENRPEQWKWVSDNIISGGKQNNDILNGCT